MNGNIKKSTRDILAGNRKRVSPLSAHFTVLAHNIRSLYNVGSIFRSADAFGVRSLILAGFTPFPPRAEISKTALGAEESVNWSRTEDPAEAVTRLKKQDYRIYGLEQTWQSSRLSADKTADQKICLVIGNEVTGIDESLLPLIDQFVEIPQYGEKHSLNVSVATGIALFAFLEKLS